MHGTLRGIEAGAVPGGNGRPPDAGAVQLLVRPQPDDGPLHRPHRGPGGEADKEGGPFVPGVRSHLDGVHHRGLPGAVDLQLVYLRVSLIWSVGHCFDFVRS